MNPSSLPETVVTRFPPSPTGVLHVGSYRTALYNYLFAKQHGGTFILRIEDTDRERSKSEYEDNINESLAWLGIEPDDNYRQSDRHEQHTQALQQLIDNGNAYISHEEPAKEGQRSEVIRFKNPCKEVTFEDMERGSVTFDTTDLGDFVIAKSMTEPLYHLAVVVDDRDSGVTYVIRGEDHISNTPRQILIQEALNAPRPAYAHIPLILASDRSKLSKRNGARAILEYRDEGFLPEAVLNYMALLGWNPGTDQEIFTQDGLLEQFSIDRIHKGGAIFSEEKMRWINREHIKLLPVESQREYTKTFLTRSDHFASQDWTVTETSLSQILPIALERIETFGDVTAMADAGEFDYFFTQPVYREPEALAWKKSTPQAALTHLETVRGMIENVPGNDFTYESIHAVVWDYADREGRGDVLWPLRYALSGREKSPDPFVLASLLGKGEVLARIDNAIAALKQDISV